MVYLYRCIFRKALYYIKTFISSRGIYFFFVTLPSHSAHLHHLKKKTRFAAHVKYRFFVYAAAFLKMEGRVQMATEL